MSPRIPVPAQTYRAIPSRFPPIPTFDDVSSADDLAVVMELEGWTNDRLVSERLARLPQEEWVFGIPNASVVMASFLHAPVNGSRFAANTLGAWYAGFAITTAIAEVAHHLRREAVNTGKQIMRGEYHVYTATLVGEYMDLRGHEDDYAAELDRTSHADGQRFGENARAAGEDGIVYPSLRHADGTNVVAYRPRKITEIVPTQHYELTVPIKGRIAVRGLRAN